jgi:AraC-like DNA-binding protein
VFDTMLGAELALLDKSDVIARCRAAVLEHLTSGEVSEEDTAKLLHMSPRTLQRKLAEARLTYQQLVDATRKDLALRYIVDAGRSISDITFSLGFSQPSAFTRAFKRWTGRSPTDYRAGLASARPPEAGPAIPAPRGADAQRASPGSHNERIISAILMPARMPPTATNNPPMTSCQRGMPPSSHRRTGIRCRC